MIAKLEKDEIKRRIRSMNFSTLEELHTYYDQADLYIHQSLAADLTFPLLNAMSKGLPIIATAAGWKEALRHLETCYLYTPRNHQELLSLITKAVHHPEEAFKLGANAQKEFNESLSFETTYDPIFSEI
ncbi:MAG: glycosyltransferase [Parachlamydiaceae bacterium]|nr:MAG: glycosyltransferase [Parachlamydiaceae bacterium]